MSCNVMYPCACYPSTRVSENTCSKTKNLAWNNCSNLWRQVQQDSEIKFEKINIKTSITYNNILLCQITGYLENSRLWNQIWPKEKMTTILRNRRYINTIIMCGIITSNSYDTFHLIWRIINLPKNYFTTEH